MGVFVDTGFEAMAVAPVIMGSSLRGQSAPCVALFESGGLEGWGGVGREGDGGAVEEGGGWRAVERKRGEERLRAAVGD